MIKNLKISDGLLKVDIGFKVYFNNVLLIKIVLNWN